MKKLAQRILSATAGIVMVAGLATAEAAERSDHEAVSGGAEEAASGGAIRASGW